MYGPHLCIIQTVIRSCDLNDLVLTIVQSLSRDSNAVTVHVNKLEWESFIDYYVKEYLEEKFCSESFCNKQHILIIYETFPLQNFLHIQYVCITPVHVQ